MQPGSGGVGHDRDSIVLAINKLDFKNISVRMRFPWTIWKRRLIFTTYRYKLTDWLEKLTYFTYDTFKCIFLNINARMSITILPKFVPKGPINNIPALVQLMAWCPPGQWWLPTHICVTRPQWSERNGWRLLKVDCITAIDKKYVYDGV